MAKKAVSANERMNRELLAALRAGQIMRGDSDLDTAKIMPNCKSTYYQRKRDPERFTIRDLRLQARNCVSKLVDVTGEVRAAEQRKAAREELEIAGGSIAYVLDLWQRAGAAPGTSVHGDCAEPQKNFPKGCPFHSNNPPLAPS